MTIKSETEIREAVRENYANVAQSGLSDCGCGSVPGCCSPGSPLTQIQSITNGYSQEDLDSLPEGADLGLGCGNPQGLAELKEGETLLDLGSGAGIDCFLAAKKVGSTGRVIGVDMTAEMIHKARENAEKIGIPNVEFRLGEIEHLPVETDSIDVILSNCVINLSPDKLRVFTEIFRVLKPGGRIAISDVVAHREIPMEYRNDMALHSMCVSGAATIDELKKIMTDAGFLDVCIDIAPQSEEVINAWKSVHPIAQYVASASIRARKDV